MNEKPIPAQKSRSNSELGVVSSHTMPKMIIPIVLVEKKHTKLIYHTPWLYQYPQLPFHRSYKNQSNILKNYPSWIMEVLK